MALSPTAPFDAIAATYDEEFSNSLVGRAQRTAVWQELDRTFIAGQCVLEINCGTGEDAVYLAKRGVHVVALDASQAMIRRARQRVGPANLENRVCLDVMSSEELGRLGGESIFDGLLSNFSGLNCVEDLRGIAHQMARLLKPGAPALTCIFGRFCAWEMAWYLGSGNFRKAFRRMRRVVESSVGHDTSVTVYYHSLRSIRKAFKPYFTLEGWRGIGVAVPPSYVEGVASRFPGALAAASRVDNALGHFPIWRNLADHQLLVFRRRDP